MSTNFKRWTPAVVVPVLVASAIIGSKVSASADIALPDKTASQVLQLINTNPNISFSGQVTKVANLGLPNINLIPAISQSTVDQMTKNMPKGMSDFIPKATVQDSLTTAIGFLSGTQKANVFVDGLTKARVQILDPMSERDLVRNGSDLWYYDAAKQTVTHHALTAAELAMENQGLPADATTLQFDINSPASVADYFISQATPTTNFEVGRATRIAGEAAYTLTMTPKTADSLVASVTIAIDAAHGLPLAVTVNAVGQSDPAFQVSFDSINFTAPSASVFAFTPPAGATVSEVNAPAMTPTDKSSEGSSSAADQAQINSLTLQGWSAVVAFPAAQAGQVLSTIKSNPLYTDLTHAVTGGRVFHTALINILITNDGRVFAGAVTEAKLLEAAAK
jgi:outer membrane lipoprotein-sorting protein